MRWLRSFPASVPPGRAYVVDDLQRLYITDYDYTPLGDIDDDVCLVEWDMALHRHERRRFEWAVSGDPSAVYVAPYILYAPGPSHWAHRRVLETPSERWIRGNEATCDLFGFGLVYLPRALVRAFLAAPAPERGRPPSVPDGDYADRRFTDQTFSVWHHWRSGRQPVEVVWDVRPVHLHY